MGKSLILKDKSARPVGYIQQTQDAVRCRLTVRADAGAYEIWLLNEQGICKKETLPSDGEELRLTGCADFTSAVLVSQGRYIAGTGKDALLLYAQLEVEKAVSRREVKTEPAAEAAQREMRREAHRPAPMRRWPPPVCCPRAVYREGMWRLGEEIIGSETIFGSPDCAGP